MKVNQGRGQAIDYCFPDDSTEVSKGFRGLNFKGKIHFLFIVIRSYLKLNSFYRKAIREKECYYGPFKGEFGHFLLHNLPFLLHLHKQKVRIHYCGMTLHAAFLKDESGQEVVSEWFPLRDFFAEKKPLANSVIPPADVIAEIEKFRNLAKKSGKAFLDLTDDNMYWYVFRNWQLNGKQDVIDYSKTYGTQKKKAVTIFPRKKGGETSPNNGGRWDYMEIARRVSPYVETVFFTGHPSMSAEVSEEGNIRLRLSEKNEDIIRTCLESELIITQHSGAVHMSSYTGADVLIIFNGKPPIKGLADTLRFRKNLGGKELFFAFAMEEIELFVKERFQ